MTTPTVSATAFSFVPDRLKTWFFEVSPERASVYSTLQAVCRSLIILPSDFPVSPGKGIRLAEEVGENGTWELLDLTLKDEDAHIDWLESQLDQINQMAIRGGCPWYLARAKALYVGPSNAYLKSRGLPSLIEEDYVTDRAAVYRPVRTVVWRRSAAAQCRSSPHLGSVR